ncbi:MAG TPA: cell division protein FtsQ/DivIB [Ferruginibacter sp.]|nr:cell division protein FtsQ/DivIB [Ferruginibacter sp.]HMP20990.1 cell division protein FtsQ/DivIB [Ferruginibacter sp.]
MITKSNIVKWAINTLWVLAGAGLVVLLAAAISREEKQVCAGLNVTIKGVHNNFFVDKSDILNTINEYIDGTPEGQPIAFFKLKALEQELLKNVWVKKTKLFFDNNLVLQAEILEREPVARVFTTNGNTFYADTACAMLPLSDKFSARLPVFTGFPSDKKVLTGTDSALLKNLVQLSLGIQADSFAMAMIDAIEITASRQFELLPKIGNTVIGFGDATGIENKLRKLKLFYSQVIPKAGWNYYSRIDIQYAGQVVAKRKEAEDKTADSLRTLQIMHLVAMDAELRASDSLQAIVQDNETNSTNISLIQQSFQRDDDGDAALSDHYEDLKPQGIPVINKPVADKPKPIEKNQAAAKVKPAAAVVKPVSNPPAKKNDGAKPAAKNATGFAAPSGSTLKPKTTVPKPVQQQSKATMPRANDY